MKIILISVVAILTAIFIIKIIITPPEILNHFVDYIVSVITLVPMATGWTVLGFTIAKYFSKEKFTELKLDRGWDPEILPPFPDLKRQIKKGESLTGIIFYVQIWHCEGSFFMKDGRIHL